MKAPLSLKLLKSNLKSKKKIKQWAINLYRRSIKNNISDKQRMNYYGIIKETEKYIKDLEAGIKKLNK